MSRTTYAEWAAKREVQVDYLEMARAVWLEATYLRYATQANRGIWVRSMADRLAAEIP